MGRHAPGWLPTHHALPQRSQPLPEVPRSAEPAVGVQRDGGKQATGGVREAAADRARGEVQTQSAHSEAVPLLEEYGGRGRRREEEEGEEK